MLVVTYTSGVIQVQRSIYMPCLTVQEPYDSCVEMHVTLDPKWIDVGRNYFVVLSPINCAADTLVTGITGVSARFYNLATIQDIDADDNGWIDGTEVDTPDPVDGVTVDGIFDTGTDVDYAKGWTCVDLLGTYTLDV